MKSESSSISGESGDVSTPGNSPPRLEKATTFAGNKPRPLRLVQENPDMKLNEEANNKRSSWIGWAFGKKEETVPSEDTIKE
jgi:hypothetical protein